MVLKGGLSLAIEAVEKALGQKIKTQQKELAHWQAQREDAEKGEAECLRQIAEMEMAVAVLRRTMGLEAAPPETGQLDAIRYRSQTILQSCLEIIRASGGQARVADITKTLVVAGKLKGRNAYSTVVKTMDRDARFRRVARGLFALVEPQDTRLI